MAADDIIYHSQQITRIVTNYLKGCPALTQEQKAIIALAAGQESMSKLSQMFLENKG